MTEQGPQTALVTGAGKRIGREIALDLGRAGWRVAVHYGSSAAGAEDAAATIRDAGGTAATFAADLADAAAVGLLVARVARDMGPVTCLINNASMFERDNPRTLTPETWDRHMAVNLRAPMLLAQGILAELPVRMKGAVINIIDQRVWNLTGDFTSYTISKFGLWGLTQTLARALAPDIRVNAIGPGPTLPSVRQNDDDFAGQWQSTPLKRPVDPAEICHGVRFILDAPAMTGQMIALDSGQHLGLGFVDDAVAG
ncbi:MAG: SDR family oxidoreductase [Rhodospirillaceae bacterium]